MAEEMLVGGGQSKPIYFRLLGDSGRLETVCLISVVAPDNTRYVAWGAVVCGRADFRKRFLKDDGYGIANGDSIALQRAQKVLKWFREKGHDFEAYQKEYGNRDHFGTVEHPVRGDKLVLLRAEGWSGLEALTNACEGL